MQLFQRNVLKELQELELTADDFSEMLLEERKKKKKRLKNNKLAIIRYVVQLLSPRAGR